MAIAPATPPVAARIVDPGIGRVVGGISVATLADPRYQDGRS
jgi:hypothetical protein